MSERIAAEKRAALTANIELQLREGHVDKAPLLRLLHLANERASGAIAQMADLNTDVDVIRKLQVEVRCFDLIVEMLEQAVQEGYEAMDALSASRREEIADLIGLNDDETDEALAGAL